MDQPRRNGSQKGFFAHCPDCRGTRLHTARSHIDADGKATQIAVCSACEHESDLPADKQPGIVCRGQGGTCLGTKFETVYTRRPAPGMMRRVRRCKACKTRIRVRETVESYCC